MALAVGTRLGAYQVLALIGVGGMGEVYRARDTKLNRDVALKVLPDLLARDRDRLARFRREAQVLASLNHPNIAAIYGLEESGDTIAIVMELVEGPTLGETLAGSGLKAHGAGLPLDEALPIARQIADALEAAHEQGVMHRDLKPANIKVRDDAVVKVLDFGLAKAFAGEAATANLADAPTLSVAATRAGMILGTPAYMSPEQARGKTVDKRTDIWAFGCVLYEMLTGRRAFGGDAIADTLAFVITKEPDWQTLPAGTTPEIRTLLRRCLEKDRTRRLPDIGVARLEIEDAERAASSRPSEPAPALPHPRDRKAWIVAAALGTIVLALGAALAMVLRPEPALREIRLEIATLPGTDPLSIAVSPDGQSVVFAATAEGRSQLFLRSIASSVAHPLARTDGASLPFWSPDGRSIAFFAEGSLKRFDIDGTSVTRLADARAGEGGSWGPDGIILFVPLLSGTVLRISATGGEAAAVTRLGEGQQGHWFPQFLPGGRHFLFYVRGGDDVRGIYIAGFDDVEPRRIVDSDAPAYVAEGHLFFVRQGTLFAQPFDAARLTLSGRPSPLAQEVGSDVNGRTALSVSRRATIIYRTGSVALRKQLVWFNRAGEKLGVTGEVGAQHPSPSMSPDGRRLAWHQAIDGNVDIWVFDLERGFPSRFTLDASTDVFPVWSPGGKELVFSSFRNGVYDLYRKPAAGAGSAELLLSSAQIKLALDWSADGRYLLYRNADPKTGADLWALPMNGDPKPFPVVATTANEWLGQFSADGMWIAYESDESGRREIYVQPFPGPGTRTQVTTSGGAQVRWSRDSLELFYIGLDERLMAVPVRVSLDRKSVNVGAPAALFPARVGGAVQTNSASAPYYTVSPDGQRFLMDTVVDEAPAPISIIMNWKPTSSANARDVASGVGPRER